MKNNIIKSAGIALTVIIIISLSVACILYRTHFHREKARADKLAARRATIEKVILKEATEITRKLDSSGYVHTIAKIEPPDEDVPVRGLIDTTAQAIGIKNRELKDATKINATLTAENLTLKAQLDEAKKLVYKYQDKYLTLSLTPPQGVDSNSHADFTYNLKLGVTKYKSKTWFLGKSQNYIDVYSEDPRVLINGIKTYSVAEKKPWFGMQAGPGAQVFWNKNMVNYGVGAAANLNLGNVRLNGGRYYNPVTGHWFNQAQVSYSIINSR